MNEKNPDPKPSEIPEERPQVPPSSPQPDTTQTTFNFREGIAPSEPQIDAGIWDSIE